MKTNDSIVISNNDNIDYLVGKGMFTGPISRYISSWSLYTIYFLFTFSIFKGDYVNSASLIIPFIWFGTSLAYIIVYLVKGQILYCILITLYFTSNILSVYFARKFVSSLYTNEENMFQDKPYEYRPFMYVVKYLSITGLSFFGFVGVGFACISAFIILEFITLRSLVNHLNYTKHYNSSKHYQYGESFYVKEVNGSFSEDTKVERNKIRSTEIYKVVKDEIETVNEMADADRDLIDAFNYKLHYTVKHNCENHFNEEGSLILKCKVNSQKARHGEFEAFYSNGSVRSVGAYKDGILHGELRNYFQNGNLSFSTTMYNGVENGVSTTYDENGNLLFRRMYFNGKLL